MADTAPNTPSFIVPAAGTRTKQNSSVAVSATVSDPNGGNVQALFRYSIDPAFGTYTDVFGTTVTSGGTSTATLSVSPDKHYAMRVYAWDGTLFSTNYASVNWYSNTSPNNPTSVIPTPGTQTKSTGSVDCSAVVSDDDGGTVRALFRYSTDDFSTYTDVYSSFVNSGTTASVTLTGLFMDLHYSLLVYAQDPQGLYGNGTLTDFWTNQTPTAPTLIYPINGQTIDNTTSQTFRWTFNDPDAGDTQSNASVRYRVQGGSDSTWVYNASSPLTSNFYSWIAHSFLTNQVYEWQVSTTDAQGATGPYSASALFVGMPPGVFISTRASMSNSGSKTESQTSAMSVHGNMTFNNSITRLSPNLLKASAALTIIPVSKLNIAQSLNGTAILSLNGTQSKFSPLNLQALANLVQIGNKTITSTQTAMTAQAALIIQITLGINAMTAQATMTTLSGPIILKPTVPMLTVAKLEQITQEGSFSIIPMNIRAALSLGGSIGHVETIPMAVHGSLSQSGAVLLIPATTLLARAQLTLAGLRQASSNMNMAALGHMVQISKIDEDSLIDFMAQASMSVSGTKNQIFDIIPLSAIASMIVTGTDNTINFLNMRAFAVLAMKDQQVVFEGIYLIVPGVNNSTMSFQATSYPTPRNVRNSPFTSSIGNVIP